MITEIEIKDFQSLEHVTIPLGRFTVVMGASNVGKSAIVRAIRLLVRNGASTGLVRKSAKTLSVAATIDDEMVVEIRRGAGTSEYRVYDSIKGEVVDQWAKMGTKAPDSITATFSMPTTPDTGELCFSGQHDSPFLISDSGSAVAKVLGSLTNVHVLMEAVREANRRKQEANQVVTARSRELRELTEELKQHQGYSLNRQSYNTAYESVTSLIVLLKKRQGVAQVLAERARHQLDLETLINTQIDYDAIEKALGKAEALEASQAVLESLIKDRQSNEDWVETCTKKAEFYSEASKDYNQTADALEQTTKTETCPECGQEIHR